MTTAFLLQDIARDEGCRLRAYPDPRSGAEPWTCGYGCTGPEIGAETVWTPEKAEAELADRIGRIEAELDHALGWWRGLSDTRQDVLVNMAYNLGVGGLLTFHATLAACEAGRFAEASRAMLASAWAGEVRLRARRLARQMAQDRRP